MAQSILKMVEVVDVDGLVAPLSPDSRGPTPTHDEKPEDHPSSASVDTSSASVEKQEDPSPSASVEKQEDPSPSTSVEKTAELDTKDVLAKILEDIARGYTAASLLKPAISPKRKGSKPCVMYYKTNQNILAVGRLYNFIKTILSTFSNLGLLKNEGDMQLDRLNEEELKNLEMSLAVTRTGFGATEDPAKEWQMDKYKNLLKDWNTTSKKNPGLETVTTMLSMGEDQLGRIQRNKFQDRIMQEFNITEKDFYLANDDMALDAGHPFTGDYDEKSAETLKQELKSKGDIINALTKSVTDLDKENKDLQSKIEELIDRNDRMHEESVRMNEDMVDMNAKPEAEIKKLQMEVEKQQKLKKEALKKLGEEAKAKLQLATDIKQKDDKIKALGKVIAKQTKELEMLKQENTSNTKQIQAAEKELKTKNEEAQELNQTMENLKQAKDQAERGLAAVKQDAAIFSKSELEDLVNRAVKRTHQGDLKRERGHGSRH